MEFNFGRVSSFYPANVLKINFAASIFQGFCLVFKNIFLQEQLPLAASISPLNDLDIFGEFPGRPEQLSVILEKL